MIEQFKHEAEGCEVFFVDGALFMALERFADDGVDIALIASNSSTDSAACIFAIIAMILLRSSVVSSRSSRFRN